MTVEPLFTIDFVEHIEHAITLYASSSSVHIHNRHFISPIDCGSAATPPIDCYLATVLGAGAGSEFVILIEYVAVIVCAFEADEGLVTVVAARSCKTLSSTLGTFVHYDPPMDCPPPWGMTPSLGTSSVPRQVDTPVPPKLFPGSILLRCPQRLPYEFPMSFL